MFNYSSLILRPYQPSSTILNLCGKHIILHEICILRAPNAAEAWQRHYEMVCFLARYSFFYCSAGLDEDAQSDNAVQFGTPWQLTLYQ